MEQSSGLPELSNSSSFSPVDQSVCVTKKTSKDEQCPSTSPSDTLTDVVSFHIAPEAQRLMDDVSETFKHSILTISIERAKFERDHLLTVADDPKKLRKARPRRLSHVLPQLTGEYKNIGYTSFIINGPHREIGVEVYAPTLDSSGKPLRMQVPKGEFEELLGTDQLRTMHTHSLDSFQQFGRFPLLIFSHGYDTDPVQYRPLLEELASHGYKVLSLNHPSSSGYAPFSDPQAPRDRDEAGVRVYERWLNDLDRLALIQADNIQFIVNYVRQQGEIEPIVLAGHSLGGAASMIAAKREDPADPTISACINLDYVGQSGRIEPLLGEKGEKPALSTPLLQIFSDHSPHEELIARDREQLQCLQDTFENVQTEMIAGTGHMDFSAQPLLTWLLGEKTLDGALKAHKVTSEAMVHFMNDWCRFQPPAHQG